MIVREHQELIQNLKDPLLFDQLLKDLKNLEHELHGACLFFNDHIDSIRKMREYIQSEQHLINDKFRHD